jgi:hypothetical protein
MPPADPHARAAPAWWNHRWLPLALIVAAALPLLWPQTPPLVDLPGHLGRYRIQLGIEDSPALARYYGFEWALIGNLGVDLLIEPLARLFGLELGTKLIVITIPALTVAGLLSIAREIHGRIPPTAFFALPLAYSFPFQFGFVNFALSMALALLAFPLWLRLGRSGRWRLRAALFVPISCLIWLCHTFGWGLLGLLAYAGEVADERDRRGASRLAAFWRGGLHCLPLALPFLLMAVWRSGEVAGVTGDWFNWDAKGRWMIGILRERWEVWDKACAALLIALPLLAIVQIGFRIRYIAVLATLFMLVIFTLMPRILIGSAYADMRLAPFMVAVAVIGLRPKGWVERHLRASRGRWLSSSPPRLASPRNFIDIDGSGWAVAASSRSRPVASCRAGQRPCSARLAERPRRPYRLFAIVRRDAFTNDQWACRARTASASAIRRCADFVVDPSQMMRPLGHASAGRRRSAWTCSACPAGAFDYLWMIDCRAATGRGPAPDPGLDRAGPRHPLPVRGLGDEGEETPNGSAARPTR